MKKYFIRQNSNCDRRRLDGRRIGNYLEKHGASPTDDLADADIVIAITCSTTHSNITESIDMVEELAGTSRPEAQIILIGCLGREVPLAVGDDKLLVRVNPKDGLQPLQQALGYSDSPYEVRDFAQTQSYVLNVRVQDGCRGKCAFCDIRQKIGSSVSRPLDEIRNDVQVGLNNGVRYIRLIGDDVGTYGVDTGSNLAELLASVMDESGGRKVMIDNLDPKYLIEQWYDVRPFVERRAIHHVKLPVQHFHPRVLALMRRANDVERIGELVDELDRYDVMVQSHFIYGFPTETMEELSEAVAALTLRRFGQVIFLPYSNKERVTAARLPQIPLETMLERNRALKDLLVASGDVVEVEHVATNGLEELVWVRESYLTQRPATE